MTENVGYAGECIRKDQLEPDERQKNYLISRDTQRKETAASYISLVFSSWKTEELCSLIIIRIFAVRRVIRDQCLSWREKLNVLNISFRIKLHESFFLNVFIVSCRFIFFVKFSNYSTLLLNSPRTIDMTYNYNISSDISDAVHFIPNIYIYI